MSTPYMQQRLGQYRGPHSTENYNLSSEEAYRDVTYLYNTEEQLETTVESAVSVMIKQLLAISKQLSAFDERLTALENAGDDLVFFSEDQIDVDRFIGTSFGDWINNVDRCTWHPNFGVMTLPYVADNSLSKIKYFNQDGSFNVANGLEVLVLPNGTNADSASTAVETSSPYDAVQAKPGMVWERNVIATSPHVNGASCNLYIRIPNELSITGSSNGLILYPFPIFDVDLLGVYYSTDPNAVLSETTTWTSLNSSQWYFNNSEAIGHTPPGSWSGDEILNSGPKLFYFEPKAITALKLTFKQNAYFPIKDKSVYTYGLSDIDVRYDKFLSTGKTVVKLDAPLGHTISNVQSVAPKIWNVSQAFLADVFTYRVIWETSFNSGNYTLNPVPNSQRIWLEITLNQVSSGFTPTLSSVFVTYT